jgi:hypothetical protein
MRGSRFAQLGATLGIIAALSTLLAPSAFAQGRGGDHHSGGAPVIRPNGGFVQHPAPGVAPRGGPGFGFRGNGPSYFRDDRNIGRGYRTPPVVIAPPVVQPVPVPQAVPVPVPVPAAVAAPMPNLLAAVLPSLEALMPAADFADNPPQFLPLDSGGYALISPVLFCGADQAATCEAMAAQLAQMTPGWGTAVLNGPDGYGVYLTYQGYS